MTDILEQKSYLKDIFREVLHEVIREERINFYQSIIPEATEAEIKDIEKRYGSPDNYKKEDFADRTDWIIQ
jgi:hypothetical protein